VKNREHFLAHIGRHPGIDAVRDDVIECTIVNRNVCDAGMPQRNVSQAKRGDRSGSELDAPAAEINSDEFTIGVLIRHWDHIGADTAAQFQHAAA
jgi:hypothetical protein